MSMPNENEKTIKYQIVIKRQKYVVVNRRVINSIPQVGEVYAELTLQKPKGQVVFSADEIFEGYREPQKCGIAFLDAGLRPQRSFRVELRPDRVLPQGDLARKIQDKSPCCNRTMREVSRGPNRGPDRFCRKCGAQVL